MRKRTAEKIAARCFTKAYLEPLLPNVYEQLTRRGYFYDDVEFGKFFLLGMIAQFLRLTLKSRPFSWILALKHCCVDLQETGIT